MLKVLGCTTLVLAVVAVAPSVASGRPVKQSLRPTGVDPNAQGVAMASIHAKRDRGKFRVSGRNLKPGTTYGISVAGVRIGSLTTRATGSGAARFSSPQHGSDQFLGVDPRGKKVEVSDDQGEDVLENEMPDDGEDQGSAASRTMMTGPSARRRAPMSVRRRAARTWVRARASPTPARRPQPRPTFAAACRTTTARNVRRRVRRSAAPRMASTWGPAAASRIRARPRRRASSPVASRSMRVMGARATARTRASASLDRRSASSSRRRTAPRRAGRSRARRPASRTPVYHRRAEPSSTETQRERARNVATPRPLPWHSPGGGS